MTEQNPEKSEQSDEIRLLETGEWERQLAEQATQRQESEASYRAKLEEKQTIPLAPDMEIKAEPVRDFSSAPDRRTPQEIFDSLYALHLAWLKGYEGGKQLVLRDRQFEKGGKPNEWFGIDASNYDLSKADLSGCTLGSWKFTNTKLHDVNAEGTAFVFCDFASAHIARGNWIVAGIWESNFGARRVDSRTVMPAANLPAAANDMPLFSRTEEHKASLGTYVQGREHLPYERRFEFEVHVNVITHAADLSGAQKLSMPFLRAGFNAGARLSQAQKDLIARDLQAAQKEGEFLSDNEQALVAAFIAMEEAKAERAKKQRA